MSGDGRTAVLVSSEVYRRAGYGAHHPLAIPRVATVLDLTALLGWMPPEGYEDSPAATVAALARFHTPDYIEAVHRVDVAGRATPELRRRYRLGTRENPVFPGVYERAATACGGSIRAAELALAGCLAFNPAGGTHHGMPDRAHGFCYFNDPVMAILTLLEGGLDRVLYLDLDAHHGDGVERAFGGDPRVLLVSIHEAGRWPHTGAVEDRAGGSARNLPVPRGFNDSELAFLMANAVLPLADAFAPEGVVVTCGADGLSGDPLTGMELSNAALWDAVEAVVGLTPHAVVLGGGGYNPWTVARCWTGLWGRLAGHPLPGRLPPDAEALLGGLDCDLVDEEELDPDWCTTLVDRPKLGPVRPEVAALPRMVLAP